MTRSALTRPEAPRAHGRGRATLRGALARTRGRAGALALAAVTLSMLVAATRPAHAAQLDDKLKQAAELDKSGACERAYLLYRDIRSDAQSLDSPARRAQISALCQTKMQRLEDCFQACQPSDEDRATFDKGRAFAARGEPNRARHMLRRLLTGKDTTCQYWAEARRYFESVPAGDEERVRGEEKLDPCSVSSETASELRGLRERLSEARGQLEEIQGLKPEELLKRVNDIVASYREIDELRIRVYELREELQNCDQVYGELQRGTTGLKEVYDGTADVVLSAYTSRVGELDSRVKTFQARWSKEKKARAQAEQNLAELKSQYESLADFTEGVFGDFFDLVGLEVRGARASVEGDTLQLPFEQLDSVLADQRKTLEGLASRYPEYLRSGASVEGLRRRRLVLEKMKKLLEKFEARGYRGVLGFERTKIELTANLALLARIEQDAEDFQRTDAGMSAVAGLRAPNAVDVELLSGILPPPPPEETTFGGLAVVGAAALAAAAGAIGAAFLSRRMRRRWSGDGD